MAGKNVGRHFLHDEDCTDYSRLVLAALRKLASGALLLVLLKVCPAPRRLDARKMLTSYQTRRRWVMLFLLDLVLRLP